MSRLEAIDLGALRARLAHALRLDLHHDASVYLLAIGALYLAATPESFAELGLWASLFDLQAQLEGVNGAEVLAVLGNVEAVPS